MIMSLPPEAGVGHVAGQPAVVLKDVARTLRAPLFKSETGRKGRLFRLVSISDMPESGYLQLPQRQIHVKNMLDKAKKYQLQPHDVLLTIVGTVGRIAIVPHNPDGEWLPSSNMLIIRFHAERPTAAVAFAMFMKSVHGAKIFEELTHGKTIPIVSKKEFSRIAIPALTEVVKKKSKESFEAEEQIFRKRKELLKEAQRLRSNFLH